jgi:DNA-binding NtrC family response regulator
VYASAGILIFGHDEMLLRTRSLVLKSAGFRVWTASDATVVVQILDLQQIDIFILCQTLSCRESEAVLAAAHNLRPELKNLVLAIDAVNQPVDLRDRLITSFLDPKSLIALIQREINTEDAPLAN